MAGARDGDEVVQLYARFPGSKVERPRNKLVVRARTPVVLRAYELGIL